MQQQFFLDPETDKPHIWNHGIDEYEVAAVLRKPGEDRRGTNNSRVAIDKAPAGRYTACRLCPRSKLHSLFVVTAYVLSGQPLSPITKGRQSMARLDLMNLSSCPFESRRVLLLTGIDELTEASVTFIRTNIADWPLLLDCIAFTGSDLQEAPPAIIEKLTRVGFFPWVEASREFDQALNQAILCHYKSVFDHLRRALELTVLGAFFTSDASNHREAREWVDSDRESPLFSRTLDALLKLPRFSGLDAATAWAEMLRNFYWQLCDVVHVRGQLRSYQKIQPTSSYVSGIATSQFTPESLRLALDCFITTVMHCATIVALTNPVLLVGLPIDEKFGLNPPASGLLNEKQAERFVSLLLPETQQFLKELATRDAEVQSIVAWVHGMPDLTDEEVAHQAEFLI